MHDAWAVNTAAVGESVLKRGGFAVPYFAAMQRNVTDPVTHCQRDMQTVCKVNKTTGRPNIHDQALLLEFSEYPDSKCRSKLAGLVCLRALATNLTNPEDVIACRELQRDAAVR